MLQFSKIISFFLNVVLKSLTAILNTAKLHAIFELFYILCPNQASLFHDNLRNRRAVVRYYSINKFRHSLRYFSGIVVIPCELKKNNSVKLSNNGVCVVAALTVAVHEKACRVSIL